MSAQIRRCDMWIAECRKCGWTSRVTNRRGAEDLADEHDEEGCDG
ncbi:hypothetical protein EDD28_0038 [Salana multivorans]|uniref:Uncharacterized protein n=1 Tax=Salana multivorans TaxID=120377 RepID=A0A3N2D6T9_9MICO|nr:hypothetical protein [Salana multivorans]ROR95485.1 hypothetical protein EDD28_0038 [Salana multivorans]